MVDGVVADLLSVDGDGDGEHLDVDERAVLSLPAREAVEAARARGLRLHPLRVGAQVLASRDQPVEVAPDDLVPAVAEEPLRLRVPGRDGRVEIRGDDRDGADLEQRLEELPLPLELLDRGHQANLAGSKRAVNRRGLASCSLRARAPASGRRSAVRFPRARARRQKLKSVVETGPARPGRRSDPVRAGRGLGAKERHHVAGTVNGMGVRAVVEPFRGGHAVALGAAWRRDCGVAPGDEVDVVLAPEGPQRDDLAPDVAAALEREPEAAAFFDSLAQFYRRGYLRWIDATKRRPEVRAERIATTVTLLKAGTKDYREEV